MHEHKTKTLYWRNPEKDYKFDSLEHYEYCDTCERPIHSIVIIRGSDFE